jgi:hypothetical protein
VVAHFHYVLVGGSLFGLFAGLFYWWPKITGRLLDEGLGKLAFWVMFAGFNAAFFPQHYLGAIGMPRRIYTYPAGAGWNLWNMVSTRSVRPGLGALSSDPPPCAAYGGTGFADPWDGRTLEWRTSPPPPHDFDEPPADLRRDTFWRKYGDRFGRRPILAPPPADEHGIHMPALRVAGGDGAGLTIAVAGALIALPVVLRGRLTVYRLPLRPGASRNPAHAHQGASASTCKLAMWTFIGSECMLFGTSSRRTWPTGAGTRWAPPHEILNIPHHAEHLRFPMSSLSWCCPRCRAARRRAGAPVAEGPPFRAHLPGIPGSRVRDVARG